MSCSVGVEWSAGVIEVSGSISWRGCFVGDFVIRLIILIILRLLCSGYFKFFLAGVLMNAVGLFEVYIVTGLPCDESDAELIISIDSFEWNWDVSNWTNDEWDDCHCRFLLL